MELLWVLSEVHTLPQGAPSALPRRVPEMTVPQRCPSESGGAPQKVLAAICPSLPRLAFPEDVPLDTHGTPQTWRGHCYSVSLESFEFIQSKQISFILSFFPLRTSSFLHYETM